MGPGSGGYDTAMTEDRIVRRAADLLPEEQVVGSDDPEAQATAILAESDRREADPEPREQRTSEESAAP